MWKPVRYEEQEYCYDCQKIIHFYEQGRSLWLHKMPVSQSIYQLSIEIAAYLHSTMRNKWQDSLQIC